MADPLLSPRQALNLTNQPDPLCPCSSLVGLDCMTSQTSPPTWLLDPSLVADSLTSIPTLAGSSGPFSIAMVASAPPQQLMGLLAGSFVVLPGAIIFNLGCLLSMWGTPTQKDLPTALEVKSGQVYYQQPFSQPAVSLIRTTLSFCRPCSCH